jgi:outer membrane protein assembly factor BamD (BamD/ComL family)
MHRASWIVGLIAVSLLTACTSEQMRSKHPDKLLFDRAKEAMRDKRFNVANLDLQTLVNTYPTSEYAAQATWLLQDSRIANCGQFTTSPEKCDVLELTSPTDLTW